jgi:uncharacterized membrane protein
MTEEIKNTPASIESPAEQTKTTPALTQVMPQAPAPPHHHTNVLFHREPHQHQPRNVNMILAAEQAAEGFNTRLAVALTRHTGTMWTAYIFTVLAFIGLFGLLGWLNPFVFLLTTWISQQFLQLVLLPVIMVGQNVLGRKSELQADEQFNTTMSTYHDIEQVMLHLCAQDAELLRHAKMLEHLLEKSGISLQQLMAEGTATSHLDSFVQPPAAAATLATPTPSESEKQNA